MAERTYAVDLPDGAPTPALTAALAGAVPGAVVFVWRELAKQHNASGQYAAALTSQDALQYPYLNDPLAVAVVNTAPHAEYVENGRAGFHLATRWGSRGGKWKVGRNGNLYAHVPFRVPTPIGDAVKVVHLPGLSARFQGPRGLSSKAGRLGAAMPESVYARALKLRHYATTRDRLTGLGDEYKQSKSYRYYEAAFGPMPESLEGEDGYTWQASQFEGMFRTTGSTAAGGHHTEYMTIRTITPDSPGWFVPPSPALRLAERALEQSAANVRGIIEAAVAQDVQAALDAAVKEFDE